MIERFLEDLENQIDETVEQQLFNDWKNFCDGKFTGDIFCPRRMRTRAPKLEWPEVSINRAIEDFDQMALQQFGVCARALAKGSGEILCVRCNYGTSILPSLFGVKLFYMEEQMNTLPTSWPLVNDVRGIEALLEQGLPDLYQSFGHKTLEMGHYFVALKRKYPKINEYVHIYHPDLQGPMDVCELLLGSQLYILIIDAPELIKKLLDLLTDAYIAFMREWEKIVGESSVYAVHWYLLHHGKIMLRDDSAMNFSPEMFDEFIKPYDQRLLTEFQGGAIHFCGHGDHYIPSMSQLAGLSAINLSQPELNNMEKIYQHTVDKGIKLIGFSGIQAREEIKNGRDFHGQVHCFDV
jgi:hypothetical protein